MSNLLIWSGTIFSAVGALISAYSWILNKQMFLWLYIFIGCIGLLFIVMGIVLGNTRKSDKIVSIVVLLVIVFFILQGLQVVGKIGRDMMEEAHRNTQELYMNQQLEE